MKFALFSDIHEHAVFSARALLDKRLFGLVNSSFWRNGSYRMERIDAAVRTILDSLHPDLVVFPGDTVSTSDPREFEAALNRLRPLVDSGIPILYAPGNHDRYVRDRACCEAFLGSSRPFMKKTQRVSPLQSTSLMEVPPHM